MALINKLKVKSVKFLDLYMMVSTFTYLLMGLAEYISLKGELNPRFLPIAFIILGHLKYWSIQKEFENLTFDIHWGSSFFLFQGLGLLYLFSTTQNIVYLTYLTFPIVAANLFFFDNSQLGIEEGVKKSLAFFCIICLLTAAIFRIREIVPIKTHLLIFLFILPAYALSLAGSLAGRIEHRNLMFLILKRFRPEKKATGRKIKFENDFAEMVNGRESGANERLFYHDLVNHIHGLSLFTEYYSTHLQELNGQVLKNLLGEINLTQKMVEDFFPWPHKNKLGDSFKSINFEICPLIELKPLIQHYLDLYCYHQGMKVDVYWKGDLSFDRPETKQKECLVHAPSFLRIMTNILKNAYEGHSGQIILNMEAEAKNVFIQIKNTKNTDLKALDNDRELAQIILKNAAENDGTNQNDGQGLDSIDELCKTMGGHFKFYLEDGWWYSEVNLPYMTDSLPDNHTPDDLKKVA